MRLLVVLVLVLAYGVAHADEPVDPIEAARQRILDDAMAKAWADAKVKPPISERQFVKWWRPAMARLTKDMCRCEFADKVCARLAMDEFKVDMIAVFFRIRGVIEEAEAAESVGEAGAWGLQRTEGILKKYVPAKERLRVQARLERCILYATGQSYRR